MTLILIFTKTLHINILSDRSAQSHIRFVQLIYSPLHQAAAASPQRWRAVAVKLLLHGSVCVYSTCVHHHIHLFASSLGVESIHMCYIMYSVIHLHMHRHIYRPSHSWVSHVQEKMQEGEVRPSYDRWKTGEVIRSVLCTDVFLNVQRFYIYVIYGWHKLTAQDNGRSLCNIN